MKIQCDVCEKAAATVICCADEAALCARCDIQVHAANKLASKHHRLLLQCLPNKLPRCDICLDKAGLIFCVEDRAVLCEDCDEATHSANTLSANHQRFLATGIRLALNSNSKRRSNQEMEMKPQQHSAKSPSQPQLHPQAVPASTSSWTVDDFLYFTDFVSPLPQPHKALVKNSLEFEELEWLADVGLFGDHFPDSEGPFAAAQVPQLPLTQSTNVNPYVSPIHKKPRIQVPQDDDDDDYFIVPDLG